MIKFIKFILQPQGSGEYALLAEYYSDGKSPAVDGTLIINNSRMKVVIPANRTGYITQLLYVGRVSGRVELICKYFIVCADITNGNIKYVPCSSHPTQPAPAPSPPPSPPPPKTTKQPVISKLIVQQVSGNFVTVLALFTNPYDVQASGVFTVTVNGSKLRVVKVSLPPKTSREVIVVNDYLSGSKWTICVVDSVSRKCVSVSSGYMMDATATLTVNGHDYSSGSKVEVKGGAIGVVNVTVKNQSDVNRLVNISFYFNGRKIKSVSKVIHGMYTETIPTRVVMFSDGVLKVVVSSDRFNKTFTWEIKIVSGRWIQSLGVGLILMGIGLVVKRFLHRR